MGARKKVVKSIAGLMVLLAACIALAPQVFEVCEAPMHCYYSYMAELGTAAVIAASGVMMLVSKGMEAPRALSVVALVAGLFVILYPANLIGVCGSPKMACNYGLLPVWRLLGGGVMLLSVIAMLSAKKEDG